jgi:hypothetical protein
VSGTKVLDDCFVSKGRSTKIGRWGGCLHTSTYAVRTGITDRHATSTMASSHTDQVILDGAREVPTSEELKEVFAVEVYDRAGDKKRLGDLIEGKRSILIFTRHFCEPAQDYKSTGLTRKGCVNCQA